MLESPSANQLRFADGLPCERKPPALPVEMSRKKAFALSIEGSGLPTAGLTVMEGFR